MALYRVSSVGNGVGGAPYYTSIYVEATTVTGGALQDVLADFWSALAPIISNEITFTVSPLAEEIDPPTGNVIGEFVGETRTVDGSATDDVMPPQVQGLIALRTSVFLAGRRVAGRVFVPAVTESAATDGVPSALASDRLQMAAEVLTDAAGTGYPVQVYSRTRGLAFPISSATPRPYFATLRSRSINS